MDERAASYAETTAPGSLSIMSFNILYIHDEARWERVVDMILKYMPDSIGMQEPTPKWFHFLCENQRFSEKYVVIPFEGREATLRKGAPTLELICYRRDRYHLENWGQIWLTDTPDVPSMVENASMKRILTYAMFTDRRTGSQLMHANTHIDHLREDVRCAQMTHALRFLSGHSDKALLLTGDFNAPPTSDTCALVSADGRFVDAGKDCGFTFPSDNPRITIDYCFADRNFIDIKSCRVCTEKIGGDYPSDHCPLFVTFDLKKKED